MSGNSIPTCVRLVRSMLSPALGVRAALAGGILLEGVAIGMGVAGPYLLKVVVDSLGAHEVNRSTTAVSVVLFVATWVGASLVSTLRMIFTARVVDALGRSITIGALRGRLPQAGFGRDSDSSQTLGLLERLPYSLQVVCEGLLWRSVPVVVQVLASVAVIAGLVPLRYVLIMTVMLGAFLLATWYGSKRQRMVSAAANKATSGVSQTVGDILRNARRVVLNGAIDVEIQRIDERLREKREGTERMWWSLMIQAGLQYGIIAAGLLSLLVLASLDVRAGAMTVGDLVLLQAYAARLITPVSSYGMSLSQAGVALGNLSDVLEIVIDSDDESAFQPSPAHPAGIELENVGFQYGPGLPGISGISAVIEPGSLTVIVGRNGSGKSTLAQIVAGVLDPDKGRVRVGGHNMAQVPRRVRHQLAMYVPQFIGLFHRSLCDNVLYPPSSQTAATVADLLSDWGFYEAGRPVDLGAMVGEQGERLSGGQIQKLELARIAGIHVPAIILDESTSSLDLKSEAKVMGALMDRFALNTTMIVITHRPTVAAMADNVLFMRAGQLVARGKHDELLKTIPGYAELWATPEAESMPSA